MPSESIGLKAAIKNEWFIIKAILTGIKLTYGELDVNEFGPRRLESYRQSLVANGLAKHTVKRFSNQFPAVP